MERVLLPAPAGGSACGPAGPHHRWLRRLIGCRSVGTRRSTGRIAAKPRTPPVQPARRLGCHPPDSPRFGLRTATRCCPRVQPAVAVAPADLLVDCSRGASSSWLAVCPAVRSWDQGTFSPRTAMLCVHGWLQHMQVRADSWRQLSRRESAPAARLIMAQLGPRRGCSWRMAATWPTCPPVSA